MSIAHFSINLPNLDIFFFSKKPGIILFGIQTPDNTGSHIIQGIVMDRKQRDNFRIGLDNLIRELSDVHPCFDRFEPPTFNSVLDHPDEGYIIRITVNPPKSMNDPINKNVIFKFKSLEYVRRNGETLKSIA